jgi:hypothetical protein
VYRLLPGPGGAGAGRVHDDAADDGRDHPDLPGGLLVDALGWEWIFFVNVPVGIVGFVLAWRLVPTLPTHTHQFDWLGVALSGAGMFLLVPLHLFRDRNFSLANVAA